MVTIHTAWPKVP